MFTASHRIALRDFSTDGNMNGKQRKGKCRNLNKMLSYRRETALQGAILDGNRSFCVFETRLGD